MDRQTALHVLQLTDQPTPDEVHAALEDHVFQLRDFLFRQTIIPQVFRAKVDRLLIACEVGETLGVEWPCLDNALPELVPLEGPADQVIRIHADNVNKLRTAMAKTLDPTCLARLGECLVKMESQCLQWMASWSADWALDGITARPMRDQWSPAALAKALESHRRGEAISDLELNRLKEELLRMRSLAASLRTAALVS